METTEKRTASAAAGGEEWMIIRIEIEMLVDARLADRLRQVAPEPESSHQKAGTDAAGEPDGRAARRSRAAETPRACRRTGGLSEDVRLCAGDVLEDLRQFVLDLDWDEMSVSCVLGAILRCWTRYGEKLTQSQLGELLGVSARLISHALHGRRSPLVAARLAEAFGIGIGDMDGKEETE